MEKKSSGKRPDCTVIDEIQETATNIVKAVAEEGARSIVKGLIEEIIDSGGYRGGKPTANKALPRLPGKSRWEARARAIAAAARIAKSNDYIAQLALNELRSSQRLGLLQINIRVALERRATQYRAELINKLL